MKFAEYCVTNALDNGVTSNIRAISAAWFNMVFNNPKNLLPAGLPPAFPEAPDYRMPIDRVFAMFGNTKWLEPFVLADSGMNEIKGKLAGLKPPKNSKNFEVAVLNSIGGGDLAQWMGYLHKVISPLAFYLNRFEFHLLIFVYSLLPCLLTLIDLRWP